MVPVAGVIGGMGVDSAEDAGRTSHLQAEESGEGWGVVYHVQIPQHDGGAWRQQCVGGG